MKVLFVRHGKDDDNYRGGWSSMDLVPEGVMQAKRLAKHLKEHQAHYGIAQILSSDLQRAVSTANYIAAELNLAVHPTSQLREINNGDLAGILNDIAQVQYPGLFFSSLDMNQSYPNGESPIEFYTRIQRWFSDFSSTHRNTNDNVLVITHGGVINIVYHLVKKVEWSNKSRAFKADNCSIHMLNMDTMKFEIENYTDYSA